MPENMVAQMFNVGTPTKFATKVRDIGKAFGDLGTSITSFVTKADSDLSKLEKRLDTILDKSKKVSAMGNAGFAGQRNAAQGGARFTTNAQGVTTSSTGAAGGSASWAGNQQTFSSMAGQAEGFANYMAASGTSSGFDPFGSYGIGGMGADTGGGFSPFESMGAAGTSGFSGFGVQNGGTAAGGISPTTETGGGGTSATDALSAATAGGGSAATVAGSVGSAVLGAAANNATTRVSTGITADQLGQYVKQFGGFKTQGAALKYAEQFPGWGGNGNAQANYSMLSQAIQTLSGAAGANVGSKQFTREMGQVGAMTNVSRQIGANVSMQQWSAIQAGLTSAQGERAIATTIGANRIAPQNINPASVLEALSQRIGQQKGNRNTAQTPHQMLSSSQIAQQAGPGGALYNALANQYGWSEQEIQSGATYLQDLARSPAGKNAQLGTASSLSQITSREKALGLPNLAPIQQAQAGQDTAAAATNTYVAAAKTAAATQLQAAKIFQSAVNRFSPISSIMEKIFGGASGFLSLFEGRGGGGKSGNGGSGGGGIGGIFEHLGEDALGGGGAAGIIWRLLRGRGGGGKGGKGGGGSTGDVSNESPIDVASRVKANVPGGESATTSSRSTGWLGNLFHSFTSGVAGQARGAESSISSLFSGNTARNVATGFGKVGSAIGQDVMGWAGTERNFWNELLHGAAGDAGGGSKGNTNPTPAPAPGPPPPEPVPVGAGLAVPMPWLPGGSPAWGRQANAGANPNSGGSTTSGTKSQTTGTGSTVVRAAEGELGRPYVWGGGTAAGPTGSATAPPNQIGRPGFDCSGLALYAMSKVGVRLPHYAASQAKMGTAVKGVANAQPGDLVFYAGSDGTASEPGHVGVYIGNGRMVDAPYTGVDVRYDSVGSPVAIRRYVASNGKGAATSPNGSAGNVQGMGGYVGNTPAGGMGGSALGEGSQGDEAGTLAGALVPTMMGGAAGYLGGMDGNTTGNGTGSGNTTSGSGSTYSGGGSGNLVLNTVKGVTNNLDVMAAMMLGSYVESGWNPKAVGAGSYGLWQIQLNAHPGVTAAQAENPQFAARYMLPSYKSAVASIPRTLWQKEPEQAALRAVLEAERPADGYNSGNVASGWQKTNQALGKPKAYQLGSMYIENDQMAQLHAGEMVIPAPYAGAMRMNQMSGGTGGPHISVTFAQGSINYTAGASTSTSGVNSTHQDAEELVDQIATKLQQRLNVLSVRRD